jgi:hypothetical protein
LLGRWRWLGGLRLLAELRSWTRLRVLNGRGRLSGLRLDIGAPWARRNYPSRRCRLDEHGDRCPIS